MEKVLIIGAGPAGLTAAYELCRKRYAVTVLEASDRIGGISQTVCCHGYRMDLGGHRFFSKDPRVMEWWNGIMPLQGAPAYDDLKLDRAVSLSADGPDPEKEDRVMLLRSRISRIYYKKHFFDYPVSLKWDTLKNIGFLNAVGIVVSYFAAVMRKRPNDCLENYYINSFGKKLYGMFFEGYTEKLWGRHPREIDAGWGRQRTKELSVFGIVKDVFEKVFLTKAQRQRHVQTSLIEEFRYPKYGPGQLWEIVADEIRKMGGEIILNSPVTSVYSENGKITGVEYGVNEKKKCMADHFISSMPLKELVRGMDNVPDRIARAAEGLPYRDFVTVGLLLDRLNIQNRTRIKTLGDIVPDCWIYVQDTGVKLGRIQIFNNWSPYMVKEPERHVWVGLEYFCNENDDFWNMTEEECVRFAAGELAAIGIIESIDDVLMSHREKVRKAYPAYFDTYGEIGSIQEWLNGFDNLYCIGRNGQHRYNNMDHSMATAFETVKNLTGHIRDRANVWNVNTEQEYHEVKRS